MTQKSIIVTISLISIVGIYALSNSCNRELWWYKMQQAQIATEHNINPNNTGLKNTIALSDLILNHMQNGGTLYFPCGVYAFDNSAKEHLMILPSNITLVGRKGLSILKMEDNSIKSEISETKREEIILLGNALDTAKRSKNIHLKNLVFDGNFRKNQGIIWMDAPILYFANTDLLRIENCILLNGVGMGVELVYCQNSVIQNNHIFHIGQAYINGDPKVGNADAIQVNGSQTTMIRSNVLENVGEGIYVQHWATPDNALTKVPIADQNTEVSFNTINSLTTGQLPNIKNLIPAYYASQQLSSLTAIDGRARGGSIGMLSQHSKVLKNTITKHSSIIVEASIKHGNINTFDVEVRRNTLMEHNKGHNLSNAAITVIADSQSVRSIRIARNTIQTSYSNGIELQNTTLQLCKMESIIIEANEIHKVCENELDTSCAFIFIYTASASHTPNISSCFSNILIRKNTLNGSALKKRFWIEKPTKNLQILNNNSNSTDNYMLNLATGACIHTYSDNIPTLGINVNNELAQFLEGSGTKCEPCSQ
jgi:Right handed beta helix region